MIDITDEVAKAIETALVGGSLSVGNERLREIARAAIDAYEKAKAADRHVIRIENGVVYFSDGTAENPAELIAKANWDNGIGKLFAEGITGTTSIKDIMKGWKP